MVKTVNRLAGMLLVGALSGVGTLLGQTPATADTVIGIEFEHANYRGASLTSYYSVTGFQCTGPTNDVDVWWNSVPQGWNDVISSYRTYAGCYVRLWEHANRYGSTTGFRDDTSYVGDAMNDEASSYDAS